MSSEKLQQIFNNNTLGSSELVALLNDYYKNIISDIPKIKKSYPSVQKKLGHFSAVNFYLDELKKVLRRNDQKRLKNFLKRYQSSENQKYEIIFDELYNHIKYYKNVITLSRSGTLLKIFKLWHKRNKKLKVIVCESRPALEGRKFALDLLKSGIKVELITDPMMSLYVPKADAAIIGADCILRNRNIINKVGSVSLALLCREFGKPLFVVTTRSKLSGKTKFKFKKEKRSEVWNKRHTHLTVSNVYFEEVNNKLITKVFTE